MYIAVFAESGFPGLVAFLGLLASVVMTLRARLVGAQLSRFVAASGVAIELAVVAVLVGGIWAGSMQYSKAAWVLMALAVVVPRMSRTLTERAT